MSHQKVVEKCHEVRYSGDMSTDVQAPIDIVEVH